MNTLYIIRGLPGAGKTSLLSLLKADVLIDMDEYRQRYMQHAFSMALSTIGVHLNIGSIAIADLFESQDECLRLKGLADKLGARSVFMVVENYHGTRDVHGVFDDRMQILAENFQIQLW